MVTGQVPAWGFATDLGEKFIAGEGQFHLGRELGLGDLGQGGLEQFGHFLKNAVVFDFGPVLGEGDEGGDDRFRAVGQAEVFQRGIAEGARRVEHAKRLVLLAGNVEVAVLLQGALGAVPPFFIFGSGNDIGTEQGLDAVGGGLRAEAADTVLNDGDRIFPDFLAQGIGGFDLLHKDMVNGKRRERFGGVGKLHDMAMLRFEVDGNAVGGVVPFLDLAKSPAAVKAVGAGNKKLELFCQGR